VIPPGIRDLILKRASNCCERCGAANHTRQQGKKVALEIVRVEGKDLALCQSCAPQEEEAPEERQESLFGGAS
jgi:ribosome-binding protein aMBF1 (putative translation factor)